MPSQALINISDGAASDGAACPESQLSIPLCIILFKYILNNAVGKVEQGFKAVGLFLLHTLCCHAYTRVCLEFLGMFARLWN